MGLIPLTFKDIAWPGRRIILLSRPLNAFLEVVVRGLGMEPKWPSGENVNKKEDVVRAWWLENDLAAFTRGWAGIACALTAVGLALSSGALLVTELYSKRSALGCVYPAFVLSWYAVGFAPAAAHTMFSKMRRQRKTRKMEALSGNNDVVKRKEAEIIISAVQGGEEWWIVQLIWAIFYIAGTLIVCCCIYCPLNVFLHADHKKKQYSSIMAVTVLELLVWVLLSAAMNAACKLLAFFICLLAEKNRRSTRKRSFLAPTRTDTVTRMARVLAEPDSIELLER